MSVTGMRRRAVRADPLTNGISEAAQSSHWSAKREQLNTTRVAFGKPRRNLDRCMFAKAEKRRMLKREAELVSQHLLSEVQVERVELERARCELYRSRTQVRLLAEHLLISAGKSLPST